MPRETEIKLLRASDVRAEIRAALHREMPAALQDLQAMLEDFNENAYLLKEWITPEEASRYVGGYWKPSTVRSYVQKGKLPGTVQGNLTMVHRPGLEEHWKTDMRGPILQGDTKTGDMGNHTPDRESEDER